VCRGLGPVISGVVRHPEAVAGKPVFGTGTVFTPDSIVGGIDVQVRNGGLVRGAGHGRCADADGLSALRCGAAGCFFDAGGGRRDLAPVVRGRRSDLASVAVPGHGARCALGQRKTAIGVDLVRAPLSEHSAGAGIDVEALRITEQDFDASARAAADRDGPSAGTPGVTGDVRGKVFVSHCRACCGDRVFCAEGERRRIGCSPSGGQVDDGTCAAVRLRGDCTGTGLARFDGRSAGQPQRVTLQVADGLPVNELPVDGLPVCGETGDVVLDEALRGLACLVGGERVVAAAGSAPASSHA
jgi:hypothetical protein